MRTVRGRRGQVYLLCRNDSIAAKYPPQPVVECQGYAALGPAVAGDRDDR